MSERKHEQQTLVTFEVAGQAYAVATQCVEQVTPLADVDCPPQAPTLLYGFLNLGGEAVPVLRLHRLFQLPETTIGLWTPLMVLRVSGRRTALLVDRVNQVLSVSADALKTLPPGHALNDCVQAVWRSTNGSILVLSPERLLLQQEDRRIAELQELARRRLDVLEGIAT